MEQEKRTQLRVGIFMAIGLAAVAGMVVYFGRFGEAVRSYYPLRVEYPNASGVLKGAAVLLAGAKVGVVETAPVILDDMEGVYVNLKIYEEVKIPSASEFTIASKGLLGDSFVQINLKKDALKSPMIEPGTTIKGKAETGFADILDQAGPMVGELRDTVKKINSIAAKIDDDVLKESTIKDITEAVANLKTTTATFAEASKKVDGLVKKAESVLDSGGAAMTSAKTTIDDVKVLVQQAKQGRGALGVLLSDRETAENLKTLVRNLKERGIIWYKDRPPTGR